MINMYIKPIHYHEFLKYGITIRSSDDLSERLQNHQYKLVGYQSLTKDCIYEYDHPIYIEPANGIAILLIFDKLSPPEQHEYAQYLFTRPIMINAHVKFCLYPYESEFSFYQFSIGSKKIFHKNIRSYISNNFIKFNIDRVYSFLNREENKDFVFKGEKHNFWELMYVDKGHVTSYIDGKKYKLRQGDIIFYRPNEYHAITAETYISYINISFNMETYSDNLLKQVVYRIDTFIRNLFENMVNELNNLDEYSVDVVTSYIKLIILRLEKKDFSVDNGTLSTIQSTKNKNDLLEQAKQVIDQNIHSSLLSVEYLAQQLNISPSYLYRIFKEKLNQNIQDYISFKKLEEAKKLISEGKYTLSQISEMLNYCSQTYFSTKFKRQYGISPREYAKSILH